MGKLKLRIMNIIYLALSGVALFWYSLNFIKPDKAPFLKIGFNAELTAENSGDLIKDEMLSELKITREDLFESGPIVIDANIQIKNQMLVDVWKSDDAVAFIDNTFIEPNVNALVDSLKPALTNVAKSAAKGVLKAEMEEQLKDKVAGGDLYAALADANPELTPEKLSQDIGAVIDELLSEDATLDSVSDLLATKYSVYNEALGGQTKTPDEMKDEIKDVFEEFNLVDEEGKINDIDEVIAFFLNEALGGDEQGGGDKTPEDDPGDENQAILHKLFDPSREDANPEEKESAIAVKLREILNEKLDADTKGTIALAFKGAGIALAVFMLGWALKLIQVILCFFISKPYVRKELIGIIAGIVQVILAAISIIVIAAFKFNLIGMATGIPVVGPIISEYAAMLSGISLELTFSAMIPGVLCLINAVYSIFYGFAKRKFKREYKKA